VSITKSQISTFKTHETSTITAAFIIAGSLLTPVGFASQHDFSITLDNGISIDECEIPSSESQSITIHDYHETTDAQLITALTRIHDQLFQEQTNLDNEAEKLLYDNLWDLYV